MTASIPPRSKRFANNTDATTGITLVPISLKAGTHVDGLPAPVVITGTRSSKATSITSFTNGDINIMLHPYGLLVRSFNL